MLHHAGQKLPVKLRAFRLLQRMHLLGSQHARHGGIGLPLLSVSGIPGMAIDTGAFTRHQPPLHELDLVRL